MRVPQFAQRPRKASQLTSGRFWCHGICFLQDGQKERRGLLTERSRGKPIDADVEKRTDDRAEDESEDLRE